MFWGFFFFFFLIIFHPMNMLILHQRVARFSWRYLHLCWTWRMFAFWKRSLEGPRNTEGTWFNCNLIAWLTLNSKSCLVSYMDIQMVQNGYHKCKGKAESQVTDEKTISEDESVHQKVYFCAPEYHNFLNELIFLMSSGCYFSLMNCLWTYYTYIIFPGMCLSLHGGYSRSRRHTTTVSYSWRSK